MSGIGGTVAQTGIDMQGRERRGDWMLTATGSMFWPLDPLPEEIHIRDIARGLAMKCRYGGHVTRFYSVAEHSVYVSRNVPPEHARQALLHDATEAYLGDMIRPLKYQADLAGFKRVEDALEPVIFQRFGCEPHMHPAIKLVDNRILHDEYQIRPLSPRPWAVIGSTPEEQVAIAKPLMIDIDGWSPTYAERAFLDEFVQLFPEYAHEVPLRRWITAAP
jgi:hypothetical protein